MARRPERHPFSECNLPNKIQQPSQANPDAGITRRTFLAGAASLGALALGGAEPLLARHTGTLPSPEKSGIEHVILVMMENRSFDHFLGWMSNADGEQAGLTYPDPSGNQVSTYPMAPDYQGCGHPDPDHSYTGGRIEYDGGLCDGWLKDPNNDRYCIGYYTQEDLAFLGKATPEWTTFSRYFAAIMAETYPNRIYQHAAQTDRLTNTQTISTLPTIWDLLAAKGVSGRYYYSDVPMLALWGTKYVGISRPIGAFYTDCAAGTMPAVSFVDPRFLGESQGTSGDDHPHSDIRNGEAFLSRIYTAVTKSPAWHKTVLIINFDEWGGFFEHVPPPTAAIPPAAAAAGDVDGRLGFRVPCLLISPWSRRGFVSGTRFNHTSVLKMIEWRWGLPSLTVRDASANNLATALNFSQKSFAAQQWVVAQGPFGSPCPLTSPTPFATPTTGAATESWNELANTARAAGWPVY